MRPCGPILALALAAGAAARAGAPVVDYIPAKDIRRGMTGYGLSVFRGTKPERFQVEVIGVLRNAMPKQDIVLARMSGAGLEKTGIIAGMSGSPIYLVVAGEARLAGAIAYGWTFPKEPICGITPFENMVAVLESRAAGQEAKGPAGGRLDAPITVGGRTFRQVRLAASPRGEGELADAGMLHPIRTPLTVGGATPPALRLLRERFEPLGFLPVQGGAASGEEAAGARVEPGGALAVRLMEGDLSLDAVGTCTAVVGEQVLAFGHPMFGEGEVSVPMATAVVHLSYPSLYRSFKLASAGRTVGRFTADVQAAVAGRRGEMARMIPVEATLRRADVRGERSFRCRVLDHPRFTPRLVGLFLLNAMLVHGDLPRRNTLRMRATVRLAGRPPLEVRNVYSGIAGSRSLMEAMGDVMQPLASLGQNPFAKVPVERIDARFDVQAGQTTARIDAVRLERNDYHAGETVRAFVTLEPTDGEPVLKTLELALPRDLTEGELSVVVCDAPTHHKYLRAEAPHRYQPRDLDQLVAMVREQPSHRRLYIRARLPQRGVAVKGVELPSLPPSILGVVASPKSTGVTATAEAISAHVDTDHVVSGAHALPVLVRPGEKP
ncbi:MAG: hypothetical protein ACLF0G_02960 [Candidatus Brocadiia bacterium]